MTQLRLAWCFLVGLGMLPCALAQGGFNASNYFFPAGSTTRAYVTDQTGLPYPKEKGRVAILDEVGNTYYSPLGAAGVPLVLDGVFVINGLSVPDVPVGGSVTVLLQFWDSTTGATFNSALWRTFTTVRITNLGGGLLPVASFAKDSDFTGLVAPWSVAPSVGPYSFRVENGEAIVVGGDFNSAAKDTLELPSTYNGLPVVRIDDFAFDQSKLLKKVILPSSLREIGAYAFSDCPGLTNITFSESVTQLGRGAFQGCESLLRVTLPSGLTIVRSNLFRGSGLTQVDLPEGLAEIQKGAFEGCSHLSSLRLPNTLTTVGELALSGTALVTVHLPASVTQLVGDVFAECEQLSEITLDPENPAFQLSQGVLMTRSLDQIVSFPPARRGAFTIPEGVRQIESDDFVHRRGLTSVVIPTSVTRVAEFAFEGCPLTHLRIPGSVQSIGYGAFQGCPLETVVLENGIQQIGTMVFKSCRNLRELVFPESLVSVGSEVFSGCDSLQRVVFPAWTQLIGTSHFKQCVSLTSIVLPSSLTYLYDEFFAGCLALEQVQLPPLVREIGAFAFKGCVNLKSVGFPAGLNTVRPGAFEDCRSLAQLYLPSGLQSVHPTSFTGCSQLRSLYFEGAPPAGTRDLWLPGETVIYHLADNPGWAGFSHVNPVAQWWPSLEAEFNGSPEARVILEARWVAGRQVVWEKSTQLMPPNWIPVLTNQMVTRSMYFIDRTNVPAQYYRVSPVEP